MDHGLVAVLVIDRDKLDKLDAGIPRALQNEREMAREPVKLKDRSLTCGSFGSASGSLGHPSAFNRQDGSVQAVDSIYFGGNNTSQQPGNYVC